jgi:hypothetical protein
MRTKTDGWRRKARPDSRVPTLRRRHAASFPGLIARWPPRTLLYGALPLLLSCSGDNVDPRITLCQRLTLALTNGPVEAAWGEPVVRYRRPEYAAVSVTYESAGRTLAGTCYYAYEITEETAMDLANPLLAYATLPYEMTLNGEPVAQDVLGKAVGEQQLKLLRR